MTCKKFATCADGSQGSATTCWGDGDLLKKLKITDNLKDVTKFVDDIKNAQKDILEAQALNDAITDGVS